MADIVLSSDDMDFSACVTALPTFLFLILFAVLSSVLIWSRMSHNLQLAEMYKVIKLVPLTKLSVLHNV